MISGVSMCVLALFLQFDKGAVSILHELQRDLIMKHIRSSFSSCVCVTWTVMFYIQYIRDNHTIPSILRNNTVLNFNQTDHIDVSVNELINTRIIFI